MTLNGVSHNRRSKATRRVVISEVRRYDVGYAAADDGTNGVTSQGKAPVWGQEDELT